MSRFAEATAELGSVGVTARSWVVSVEEVLADGAFRRADGARAVTRVVVGAVLLNPCAGRYSDDLTLLAEAGHVLGRVFAEQAQQLLPGELESYGKAGIVGEAGELEHVAALLHPRFGKPVRDTCGGVSIIPSAKKRGGQGATIDIPLHHKKAMMIRTHFDAVELRVGSAPRADEILVALGAADGPRLHARVGGLSADDAVGVDGLR